MAIDITPEFGCEFTGEWSFPATITFRLAGGDYTIEFNHRVDTIDTVVKKLTEAKRVEVGGDESPNYNLNDWKLPGV